MMKNLLSILLLTTATFVSAQVTPQFEKQSVFTESITSADTLKKEKQSKEKKILINVSAGPSIRTAKSPKGLPNDQKDYYKDLKSGFAYDVSAYYLTDENTGYGLKYSGYKSKASISGQLTDPSGETGFGTASDDITITFIGASAIYLGNGFLENDNVSLELSLGYIGYANDAKILNSYKITGGSLGISTTGAYHFGITENVSIGPAISFTGGVLSKFKIKGNGMSQTINLEDDMKESLYRLDFSISARFKF